ncbi:glycosyltransferase [Cyanobium sp. FGCU-52]|nr:glycosyltransferase [Cyanobium sp. FGCU52]
MTPPSHPTQRPTVRTDHLHGWAGAAVDGNDPLPPLTLSVVIPTLNQGDTIEDTLASILAQDCLDHLEIIVMDGGSTDGTLAVLERYRPWITQLITGPDGGQSQAINRGFSLANGDILAWINSDDYYLPCALPAVLRRFAADPELQFLVGAGDVVSLDNRFLRHVSPLPMNATTMQEWKLDRWVMQQSCFWRRELWQRVGGVDESLHLLMDYDLWFRFSKLTEAGRIEQTLAAMRYYPQAKTVRYRNRSAEEMAYVYAKNGSLSDLRELLVSLGKERSNLEERIHRFESLLPVRVLKRLRLLPRV